MGLVTSKRSFGIQEYCQNSNLSITILKMNSELTEVTTKIRKIIPVVVSKGDM